MPVAASDFRADPGRILWQVLRRQILALFLCVACVGDSMGAHGEDLTEYQVKAAFLYNFAVYTEWPQGTTGTLNLCLYGHDPFGNAIDELHGKTFGVHTLKINRKKNLESLKSCHIVFVASADIEHLPRVLSTLSEMPVLTITDTPGSITQGVAINMRVVRGHVQFELNLQSLRRAGLGMGSGVLRLAVEVIQ